MNKHKDWILCLLSSTFIYHLKVQQAKLMFTVFPHMLSSKADSSSISVPQLCSMVTVYSLMHSRISLSLSFGARWICFLKHVNIIGFVSIIIPVIKKHYKYLWFFSLLGCDRNIFKNLTFFYQSCRGRNDQWWGMGRRLIWGGLDIFPFLRIFITHLVNK